MMIYDDNYIKNRQGMPVATAACNFDNISEPMYVRMHYHRDFEIIYVDKGKINMQLSGRGFSVNEGDLIFINPFEPHYGEIIGDRHAHRCINFDIGILDIPEAEALLSGEVGYLNVLPASTELKRYFDLAFEATVQKGEGWELCARGALMLLFSLLAAPVGRSGADKERLFSKAVLDFLEENYSADITSAQLSERLSYNHSYFCRRFRRVFACSFAEYLNMFRVSKAKKLLGEQSVASAAVAAGFTSLSYFSRVFKGVTGITPSAYKKQIKEKF